MQHQVAYAVRLKIVFIAVLLTAGPCLAQSGLTKSGDFYLNYGKETYAKLQMEKDIVGLYDYFGEHIVDGIRLYTLSYQDSVWSDRQTGLDSTVLSKSNEYQKADFYEKFSNLVVTQDAIGGTKTSFLIGDQISTRFTPLTFNMVNFRGIRWDVWTSPLQASFILSRTRPGYMAKKNSTGTAPVEYPISNAEYNEGLVKGDIQGWFDDSRLSPYGDYDLLWALHGNYSIMDNLNIGLTAVNHHVNDVRRGTNPFKGQLPDSLMPNYIHFEFYDGTNWDTLDAGVFVDSVTMFVNGSEVEAREMYANVFRRAFTGNQEDILVPRDIPLARPQSGDVPVIVEFAVDPKYWQFKNGQTLNNIRDVKTVKFSYSVAGNYMVYATTDRQIPLAIGGTPNPVTRKIDYRYPTRSVGHIYDKGLAVGSVGSFTDPSSYSTTYFGQYIAQSPRTMYMTRENFADACHPANKQALMYGDLYKYNYHRYEWTYGLNVSSETYGVNFKGEVAGVNFSGEVALNRSENMLPGSETSRKSDYKWVGTLKATRDLAANFALGGEAYYVAPQWMTNLDNLQASRYFSKTGYKEPGVPDYFHGVRPLGNEWQNIDDNDDNDQFPENNRRRYPSDINPKSTSWFYADGRLKDTLGANFHTTTLWSSNMDIVYDDPNGVVASKTDKNKNGSPDYYEDFLLFNSDPLVFELGQDLNNNGTPDAEEDDITPDYGYNVGYAITGDGYRSLGIKGFSLDLQYKLSESSTINLGGRAEATADRDFILGNDAQEGVQGLDKMEGQAYVGYVTARRDVIDRSAGLLYNLGVEVRYVRDALRNDFVQTNSQVNQQSFNYNVSYDYWIDNLNYRNAIVGNAVASVVYNQIPNFEYGFRIRGGAERHMLLTNPDGSEARFYIPWTRERFWRTYPDRLVGVADLVNRVQYKLRFSISEEDWRSSFDFLNNLEIIPQYKIAFSMRKEFQGPDETQVDPRDIRKDLELDADHNGEIDEVLDDIGSNLDSVNIYRSRWGTYQVNNTADLINVPILRLNYKIAENTMLQFGTQWLRYFDLYSPENNFHSFTFLGQVVSKANYKGFSVTLFLGGMWQNYLFDVNARDPVIGTGSRFNISGYTFFARLFSGI